MNPDQRNLSLGNILNSALTPGNAFKGKHFSESWCDRWYSFDVFIFVCASGVRKIQMVDSLMYLLNEEVRNKVDNVRPTTFLVAGCSRLLVAKQNPCFSVLFWNVYRFKCNLDYSGYSIALFVCCCQGMLSLWDTHSMVMLCCWPDLHILDFLLITEGDSASIGMYV